MASIGSEYNKIELIIIKSENYNQALYDLIEEHLKGKKVCFVTLNKSCELLIKNLKEKKLNTDNFYFIDCVTSSVIKPKDIKNCTFISSPQALNELSLTISTILEHPFDVLLIDDLTTLSIYHKNQTILQLIHSLVAKARSTKSTKLIFTSGIKDKENSLLTDIIPLVDKVIEY